MSPTVSWCVRPDITDWERKINMEHRYRLRLSQAPQPFRPLLNAFSYCQIIFTKRGDNTHINYHFTALAGSYLCEDLQDKGLGDISGQIPHIPAIKERDEGVKSLSNRK